VIRLGGGSLLHSRGEVSHRGEVIVVNTNTVTVSHECHSVGLATVTRLGEEG
jgi:hypothetical protein